MAKKIASCVAFFYPAWWLAMLIAGALPACVAIILGQAAFVEFFGGPLRVAVASEPRAGWWLQLAVVLVTAAMVAVCGRHHRLLAGLFLAVLGQEALSLPLGFWVFRGTPGFEVYVSAASYAILLIAGLGWMMSSQPAGYWRRLGLIAAGFVAPLCGVLALGARGNRRGMLFLLAPSAAAALIAAIPWRIRPHTWEPRWRIAVSGALLTVLLALTATAADRHLRQTRARELAAFNASLPKPDRSQPYPKLFFQKGVNFTAEGPRGYDPRFAAARLDQLKQRGVDSIALVPYNSFSVDQPRIGGVGGWERADLIESVAALAHQRGMKVMLKPQLWGRVFVGDLHFDKAEDRRTWFEEYGRYVEFWARLADKIHADIFVVGVELRRMSVYEQEWRGIITRVRQIYQGPLTYAAIQGPEFENLRFWDALDYIGLNNYYPLPDDLSAESVVKKVEDVQGRFQKPVIFPEAGYSSVRDPHRAPWEDGGGKPPYTADQARCYEAVFQAFYRKPWFQGVYWWKVGASDAGPRDSSHSPWNKPAMDVVARWYGNGAR